MRRINPHNLAVTTLNLLRCTLRLTPFSPGGCGTRTACIQHIGANIQLFASTRTGSVGVINAAVGGRTAVDGGCVNGHTHHQRHRKQKSRPRAGSERFQCRLLQNRKGMIGLRFFFLQVFFHMPRVGRAHTGGGTDGGEKTPRLRRGCAKAGWGWWAQQDLNPRPSDYESPALTN